MFGERAKKAEHVVLQGDGARSAIVGKAQQGLPQPGQERFKRHAANDGRAQRAAEKRILGDGCDLAGAENVLIPDRQAGPVLHAAEALDDRRILQQKRFGTFAAQAEREGLAVVAGRVGALTQCLVGGGEIVLARRIQFVRCDGLGQRLRGQPVIAGCLIQQAHDVQRGRLPGVEREDLLAEHFRVDRAAFLKGKRGSGRELGQVRRRLSLAARQCGPAISSAHAASPRAGRLSSNRHPTLAFCLSIVFSETRLPRFRIHALMPAL